MMVTVILVIINPIMKASGIELKRCNAMLLLEITGTIRGTSQTKIYKELGLESLKF